MKMTFFEPKRIFTKQVENWEELYYELADYNVVRKYYGNNVDEHDYKSLIEKLATNSRGLYDVPKNERYLVIDYLDVRIQVENLIINW